MAKYVGAIDQGTTSTRFCVFDRRASMVASAQQEHRQIYPRPGWVEHDAEEIWVSTRAVIAGALKQANLRPSDLAAIGVANQRETTVLWDRHTGRPLHHALVWQDTRVDQTVAGLIRAGEQDRFRAITGLPIASYFSALKLQWLLDQVPGARVKAEAGDALFGTVDSWLVWHLTGGLHITDVTNASRTQLLNLRTLAWDRDLLETLRIPEAVLPTIRSSSEIYASATIPELQGVPIAAILGDQQAALFGQTSFCPGEAKNTYGTGCFLLMNTGAAMVPSKLGLLTTVAYQLGEQPACYALEGSVAIAGALVQWLRDNLGIIRSSAEIEALASSVPDNGDVYIVPAFSGLYTPHWQENARGVITGLTRYANRAHIARAALEATAFQTREVLEAMERDSSIPITELRTDGGMVCNELLMQFQADILNLPVVRPKVAETTALGAAYAAGLAVGYWESLEELTANWSIDKRWLPAMPPERRASLFASWNKAVTRSLDWV